MKQITFNEWKAKEIDKLAKPGRRKKRRPKKRERVREEGQLSDLDREFQELVRSF